MAFMFVAAAGVQVIGLIFYAIFASGEQQVWAEPPPEPTSSPLPTATPAETDESVRMPDEVD